MLDVLLIIVFAASGRSTHQNGLAPAGILLTAAPFLGAYVIGWIVLRGWRSPARLWPTGLGIWVSTAVGGLLIRAAFGGGVAFSFQVVAIIVLGTFLLLPRLIAAALLRRQRSTG